MTCIFVTGPTGVLGRATIRIALEHGFRVRALARNDTSAAVIRSMNAEPVPGSLFDAAGLADAIGDSAVVLHLATRIPPTNRLRRRDAWVENDRIRREGTRNLVDAALACGVATLVYPSVTLVYPDCGAEWIDVTLVDPEPATLTETTLDAEREVTRFAASGRHGIALRMGPFYGPQSGQSRYVLDLARRGFSPFIARDTAYHPFIWIEDAAAAVVAAIEGTLSGTFDIVDDEPLTVLEIMSVLARVAGRRRLWRIPSVLLSYSLGPSLADLSRRSRRVCNAAYRSRVGWVPSVPSARVGWELMQALTPRI